MKATKKKTFLTICCNKKNDYLRMEQRGMIHATRKSGMAGIATRHFSPGFCRPQRRTDLVPVGAVSFMLFSKCYRTEVIIFDLIQFLLKKNNQIEIFF
jgi:hypothetical protein